MLKVRRHQYRGRQSTPTEAVERRRDALRSTAGGVFVDRDAFCHLLLSRQSLVRSDDSAASLQGVLEPETGVRYLIESERLFPGQR